MVYERENIRRMQGYTPGEQPDDRHTLKLNTNENPYPPSPAVANALAAFDPERLRRYPQPTADTLRETAAHLHGLRPEWIVATNGGDELLRLALTTFLCPGAPLGVLEPSYSLYGVLAEVHGSPVVQATVNADWSLPVDLASRLNAAGARLACVVNPHAPSGHLTSTDRLSALARDFAGVLLIDEAYVDFVDPAAGYDATMLVREHDNVLLLRTLSKGYALAGLRLGYGIGRPELLEPMLTKTRDSYNVDAISQALGVAALGDQRHARDTWQRVRAERDRVRTVLASLGLQSPVSHSNFVLAEVPEHAGRSAAQLYAALKARGLLVRYFDTPALRDRLRITVGSPEQNTRLLGELAALLG